MNCELTRKGVIRICCDPARSTSHVPSRSSRVYLWCFRIPLLYCRPCPERLGERTIVNWSDDDQTKTFQSPPKLNTEMKRNKQKWTKRQS